MCIRDSDDLEFGPGRLAVKALQAAGEVLHVILVRDQNRDQRLHPQVILHFVGGGKTAVHRASLDLFAGQVLVDGPLCSLGHIGLGPHAAAGAALVQPPVIEHLGDVADLFGLFGEAEKEVVVLAAVKLGPQAAHLPKQLRRESRDMADIVAIGQIIRCV